MFNVFKHNYDSSAYHMWYSSLEDKILYANNVDIDVFKTHVRCANDA